MVRSAFTRLNNSMKTYSYNMFEVIQLNYIKYTLSGCCLWYCMVISPTVIQTKTDVWVPCTCILECCQCKSWQTQMCATVTQDIICCFVTEYRRSHCLVCWLLVSVQSRGASGCSVWWTLCRGCRGRWRSSRCSPLPGDYGAKYCATTK